MRLLTTLILCSISLSGCQNSCQSLCVRMAKFADECGYNVPDEQVDACIESQKGSASSEDRSVCREFGNLATIEEEWTCDDVSIYFANPEDFGNP